MRYLPRPRGQRFLTPEMTLMYSFTRPLILETELSTLATLPENGVVMVEAPRDSLSAALTLTEERPAMASRRSPMEDRERPLPLAR